MAINIIKEKCIGCGQCFSVCPADAFEFERYLNSFLGVAVGMKTVQENRTFVCEKRGGW